MQLAYFLFILLFSTVIFGRDKADRYIVINKSEILRDFTPRSELFEIRPKFSFDVKAKMIAWLKGEFESVIGKPGVIKSYREQSLVKVLNLLELLSESDEFKEYFVAHVYNFDSRNYSDNKTEKNIEIGNLIRELSKSQDDNIQRFSWYFMDLLTELNIPVNFSEDIKNVPMGNWSYMQRDLTDYKFKGSTQPDPKYSLTPLKETLVVAVGYVNKTREPVFKTGKVNGLIVTSLPNSKSIGMPTVIYGEISPSSNSRIYLTEDTGLSMKRSLTNAAKVLETRFPILQESQVQVSFESIRNSKDGNSAGVAFTLLLLSMYEGIKLDEKVAVTGVILPDGAVRAVGGVPSKMRGALTKGISIVVIPEENKQNVDDLTLLYEMSTIWKLQVFSATKITDVLKIASLNKHPAYDLAIKKFDALIPLFDAGNESIIKNREKILSELSSILKLAPNHESARVLNNMLTGKRPVKLSIDSSIDQIFMISERTLGLNLKEVYESAEESLTGNLNYISRNQSLLDNRVIPFVAALREYITALIKYRKIAVLNLHKSAENSGTATNIMDSEFKKMEESRASLSKAWQVLRKELY